jgi:hypothetical protein
MGVFKKLTGGDLRVTPIQVKFAKTSLGAILLGTNKNPSTPGNKANREDFYDGGNTDVDNDVLLYNSIRQLFYGSFITQDFLNSGSVFTTPLENNFYNVDSSTFSRFDPSFQGSLAYERDFPIIKDDTISILSLNTADYGESIVPGTIEIGSLTDDLSGNLLNNGTIVGNVFYDQGIIVRTDGSAINRANFSGSYTIYSTQYKCTASPGEFNYSLNPTLLSGSNIDYNLNIVDSPDFMPYVTTIGLYNENDELMMVAKLAQAVKLNPYIDTNFIIRLDR